RLVRPARPRPGASPTPPCAGRGPERVTLPCASNETIIAAAARDLRAVPERGAAMSTSETSTELRFEPPGPGSWEQDPVHFPRPMTRYWQETHPPAFKKGTNGFARFYGLLIDG